jgi:hypothetical protein
MWSSGDGIGLMTVRLWVRTSDPTMETIFYAPFTWINSLKQKETMVCDNLPGTVECAVI